MKKLILYEIIFVFISIEYHVNSTPYNFLTRSSLKLLPFTRYKYYQYPTRATTYHFPIPNLSIKHLFITLSLSLFLAITHIVTQTYIIRDQRPSPDIYLSVTWMKNGSYQRRNQVQLAAIPQLLQSLICKKLFNKKPFFYF